MQGDVAFALLIFLANMVQTVTGFAGTVLVMPFAIMLKGPDFARALLNIVALLMCGYITARDWKKANREQLAFILPLLLSGIVAGLWLYSRVRPLWILNIYAVFILATAVLCLVTGRKITLSRLGSILIILLAGIAHGMFVSGGPLLVLYVLGRLRDKVEIRATLSAVWVAAGMLLAVQHGAAGLFTADLVPALAYSVPAMMAGVWVGGIVYRRVRQQTFMAASYVLLIVTALYMLG